MRFSALLTPLACGVLFQTVVAPSVASAQAPRAAAARAHPRAAPLDRPGSPTTTPLSLSHIKMAMG